MIIPAFNAEATLEDVLYCLRAQTFAAWEVIVVDDGSNDKTAQIVSEWSRHDRRIRLVKLENNSGVSVARNAVLKMAVMHLVLFLDADDWIGESHLDQLGVAFIKDRIVGLAFSHASLVSYDGKLIQVIKAPPADRIGGHAKCGCPFFINACSISRQLCVEVGNLDSSLSICEDWDYWIRLAATGTRFAAVPKASAFYRQHRHSTMHQSSFSFKSIVGLIKRAHTLMQFNGQGISVESCGSSANEVLKGIFYQVVWYTGHRIASKRDVEWALSHTPQSKIEGITSDDVVNGLTPGIVQGAGVTPIDLAGLWPRFRSSIAVPIRLINNCLLDNPTVKDTLLLLDRRLLDVAGFESAPNNFGDMQAMRWHLEDGWPKDIKVHARIKALRIYMTAGGALIGSVDTAVDSSGSASLPPSVAAFPDALPASSLIKIFWALPGAGRLWQILQLLGGRGARELVRDLLKLPREAWRGRILSFIADSVDILLRRFA